MDAETIRPFFPASRASLPSPRSFLAVLRLFLLPVLFAKTSAFQRLSSPCPLFCSPLLRQDVLSPDSAACAGKSMKKDHKSLLSFCISCSIDSFAPLPIGPHIIACRPSSSNTDFGNRGLQPAFYRWILFFFDSSVTFLPVNKLNNSSLPFALLHSPINASVTVFPSSRCGAHPCPLLYFR